eukprot:COSAG01_NODE_60_length_29981_cov_23.262533_32_plen_114_part_00
MPACRRQAQARNISTHPPGTTTTHYHGSRDSKGNNNKPSQGNPSGASHQPRAKSASTIEYLARPAAAALDENGQIQGKTICRNWNWGGCGHDNAILARHRAIVPGSLKISSLA